MCCEQNNSTTLNVRASFRVVLLTTYFQLLFSCVLITSTWLGSSDRYYIKTMFGKWEREIIFHSSLNLNHSFFIFHLILTFHSFPNLNPNLIPYFSLSKHTLSPASHNHASFSSTTHSTFYVLNQAVAFHPYIFGASLAMLPNMYLAAVPRHHRRPRRPGRQRLVWVLIRSLLCQNFDNEKKLTL